MSDNLLNPNAGEGSNMIGATPAQAQTPTPVPTATITSDDAITTETMQNDLEELIAAGNKTPQTESKVEFGTSSDEDAAKKKKEAVLRARGLPKRISLYSGVILLFVFVGIVGYLFFTYLQYRQTNDVPSVLEKYMPWVEKRYLGVMSLLGKTNPNNGTVYSLIPLNGNTDNTAQVIQATNLDYIGKKKVLEDGAKALFDATAKQYDKYDELKQEVGQQGYFPKELKTLATGVFFDNSLQQAIISTESVRFTTALKFFSQLDSFMTQLSAYTSLDKNTLQVTLDNFLQRGERDIYNYIVSCYLNGYEISTNCRTIGDFEGYYKYYQDTGFNRDVFLKTMNLLEAKLENTDFPSLDIAMKSINPLENTINLSIEINTFKEDEAELTTKRGILNPHIYLVTSIINNLRESRYVMTDSINVSELQVNKKKIKIGGQTVVVNSSTFDFQLPLQQNVQREIYDFTDLYGSDKMSYQLLNLDASKANQGNARIGTDDVINSPIGGGILIPGGTASSSRLPQPEMR